jgi:glutamate synthase (NADPH/NADH) large chain
MSGGIAYVLDLSPARLNAEMVDVDPLAEPDVVFLREVVSRHHAETGSRVAADLLGNWDAALARFTKIMPKDYKRVLSAASAAEREGRDVNEAVMAAAHG